MSVLISSKLTNSNRFVNDSELKRREKQREKDAKKAEKAAAAPPPAANTAAPAGPNEDDLNPNVSLKSVIL